MVLLQAERKNISYVRVNIGALLKRVLFLQCVNAGVYPPIIHAAHLLADNGWFVDILSSPDGGTSSLQVAPHPRLTHHFTKMRPQNAIRPVEYFRFLIKAVYLSVMLRPDIVYASDVLAAAPGLISAQLSAGNLVYHEHDSQFSRELPSLLAAFRRKALERARIVILPNAERGKILCQETNLPKSKLRIVWNMPCRSELPNIDVGDENPLNLYFHGSITPDRLPETVLEAVRRFNGQVRLSIAGYEAPGASGYLAHLKELGVTEDGQLLVSYLGQIPYRNDLMRAATKAHVGLSFMPSHTKDLNMRNMIGASNKPFDYLAAGLALLVSDLPEWNEVYVSNGFGRACDISDPDSIANEISWFLKNPLERKEMGERGRRKIETEWNYDVAFAPIIEELNALRGSHGGLF